MKKLFVYLMFTLILSGLSNQAVSQTIYEQSDCFSADIKLHITENRADAIDAVVYWTDTIAKSKIDRYDGAWYKTGKKSYATLRVCYTEYEWNADYVIWEADTPILGKIINRDLKLIIAEKWK